MNNQNNYLIPAAIVFAAVLITGAVIYSRQPGSTTKLDQAPIPSEQNQQNQGPDISQIIKPISSEDHIRGNPNAALSLIEYSDLQCPFCARFHPTMKQIMQAYSDKVKWVYRHLPLSSIHPQALPAALASECVAELGGNEAFWGFIDQVLENQEKMGPELYQEIAQGLEIDLSKFDTCVASEKYKTKISQDLADAENAGIQGTPFTLVITKDGTAIPIEGAYPFEAVKQIIDQALSVK